MQLVILLSLAVLASSASLNDDLCVKGESFRCQSLAVAEACGAVDHCKETIWKNMNLEEDESDVCLFCKAVISEAREMSAAGKSENEVISFLRSASDLLPDVAKASQSKKTIQTKSLQNVLNSEIEPQVVCSLLDVCKGLPFEEDLPKVAFAPEEIPEQLRVADDPLCNDCKRFFVSLKNLITGATPPLVTDVIVDQVCPHLGPYKKLCVDVVSNYLPAAINITAGFLDPTKVCQSIQMCPKPQIKNLEEPLEIDLSSINWEGLASFRTENLVLEQPSQTDEVRQPDPCKDCNTFFASLKDILKTETPPFISDIIVEKVCPHLGKFRKQCEDAVKAYLPSLLKFAAEFLDANQACRLMRMCKNSHSEIELDSISWTKLFIPNETKEGETKACETCKQAVQYIQSFLKSETVRTYIEMLIGKLVCARLKPFQQMCEKLVKTELRMVLDVLVRLMDPSKVCRMIRLCKTSVVILDEDSLPVLEESEALGPIECTMCETIISLVRSAIDNNKTEEEIVKAMHGLCGHLPSQRMVAACNKFVDDYARRIIDAIRQQLQPHDICAKFGLCTALNFDLLDVAAAVGSEPCVICRSFVQYMEAYFDQSDTVAKIQATLKTLCHSLSPAVEQQLCLPFVEKYVPRLVHELSVALPPKFFCTKIRICID